MMNLAIYMRIESQADMIKLAQDLYNLARQFSLAFENIYLFTDTERQSFGLGALTETIETGRIQVLAVRSEQDMFLSPRSPFAGTFANLCRMHKVSLITPKTSYACAEKPHRFIQALERKK